MTARVFVVRVHVTRLQGSIMPPELAGAYAWCLVGADDHDTAVQRVLGRLLEDGLYPEEILTPLHEMTPDRWQVYAQTTWPNQTAHLPDQAEFESVVAHGGVVYGPFAAYEANSRPPREPGYLN